jgi:hypothetical protein
MMQFYLIAVPMYRLVKRFNVKMYIVVVIFSQVLKRIFSFIIFKNGYSDIYYVIACMRQLFTTIDLFTVGMCSAMIYKKMKNSGKKISSSRCISICIVVFISLEVGFVYCIYSVGSMYCNGFKYCIWEPIIGILL